MTVAKIISDILGYVIAIRHRRMQKQSGLKDMLWKEVVIRQNRCRDRNAALTFLKNGAVCMDRVSHQIPIWSAIAEESYPRLLQGRNTTIKVHQEVMDGNGD